jgi:hypothetical protein
MPLLSEDIKSLSAPEKAALYYLLGEHAELNNYLFSDKRLFEELARRDADLASGKIQLMSRQELTEQLNQRSNVL